MTDTSTPVGPDIASKAAHWFARLQEEDASEEDFQEWQRWLAGDPVHQRAYREIEHAWSLVGKVPTPWATHSTPRPTPEELPADAPHINTRQRLRPATRLTLRAVAASVLIALAFALTSHWTDMGRPSGYSTTTAEQRSIRLSDGSRIVMGAQTELKPLFNEHARRVALGRGEAFFDIAHDPSRPFTVIVGSSEIRAIGTAFNVRALSDRILVTVTEGRVAVTDTDPGAEIQVAGGEQITLTRSGQIKEKRLAQNAAASWVEGRFEYRGEPLRDVIEDLNRYADHRIVLTDPSLGSLRYSGTVFADHLDEWLEGLTGVLPVTVRDLGNVREIVPAR